MTSETSTKRQVPDQLKKILEQDKVAEVNGEVSPQKFTARRQRMTKHVIFNF
jgi:hypothetical protein